MGGGLRYQTFEDESSSLTLSNCVIQGDSATSHGGGLSIRVGSGATTARILGSTVSANHASEGVGGAMDIRCDSRSTFHVVMEDCSVNGNSAKKHGGGICLTLKGIGAYVKIADGSFTANRSGAVGGAVASFRRAIPVELRASDLKANSAEISYDDVALVGGHPELLSVSGLTQTDE